MDIMTPYKIDKSCKILSPFRTSGRFFKSGIIILSAWWMLAGHLLPGLKAIFAKIVTSSFPSHKLHICYKSVLLGKCS